LIKSVNLKENGNLIDLDYLKYAPQRKILKSDLSWDDPLRVYWVVPTDTCLEDCEDGQVNKVYERVVIRNGIFDLGEIANELKREGLVINPFIIWSSDSNVLVRNSYLED